MKMTPTLERQMRETDAQLNNLRDAALATQRRLRESGAKQATLRDVVERQKTDIAALRDSMRVASQLYSQAIEEKSQAREAIVRALTQLREHAPGAAVETLEAWLAKDKAL